jgi:hypothetical protein
MELVLCGATAFEARERERGDALNVFVLNDVRLRSLEFTLPMTLISSANLRSCQERGRSEI